MPVETSSAADALLRCVVPSCAVRALVEIRYRDVCTGRWRQDFHAIAGAIRLPEPTRFDAYVGPLPRMRRSGRCDAVADGCVAWVDCDDQDSLEALEHFEVPPSLVIASGTDGHCHAYWSLSHPVPPGAIERANRRLAATLGSDPAVAHANAVMRLPGTLNHKTEPPTPVRVVAQRPGTVDLQTLLAVCRNLPKAQAPPPAPRTPSSSPLASVPPEEYVGVLLGVEVPPSRKVRCPGPHEDRTPSLHVYPTAERGWFCLAVGPAAPSTTWPAWPSGCRRAVMASARSNAGCGSCGGVSADGPDRAQGGTRPCVRLGTDRPASGAGRRSEERLACLASSRPRPSARRAVRPIANGRRRRSRRSRPATAGSVGWRCAATSTRTASPTSCSSACSCRQPRERPASAPGSNSATACAGARRRSASGCRCCPVGASWPSGTPPAGPPTSSPARDSSSARSSTAARSFPCRRPPSQLRWDPPIVPPEGDDLAWALPRLANVAHTLGCTLACEHLPPQCGGYFQPASRTIAVNAANSTNHQV
jgi:hypothetical protein